ncbi:MAG: NYN domain-containing protein [Desulfobacteraceae bacterium]|nr:NYN domain-containing protein [Desulfobacteraceae bacterium]MCF8094769.1 NYN domain-containing protein [Desulfobacteraceae bacterium]
MGLHLIIDGYNLIRRSGQLSRAEAKSLELGRQALIDRLAAYKRVKGHKVTVVFDGAANRDDFSRNISEKGVRIRFSRYGQSADAVIKKMAARERERALVVTADRALADAVTVVGAAAVEPEVFEEKMEMAALMEIKGEEPEEESGGSKITTRKKGPSKKPPKAGRRRMRKVKKL